MLDYAKFQINKVTQCYLEQGWRIPYEIDYWIHQPWINRISSNQGNPIDYQTITDTILCEGAEEAIAIVTFIDKRSQKIHMVYGQEKRMVQKLKFKVVPGTILKIKYIMEGNSHPQILNAFRTHFPSDLTYAKVMEGNIKKKSEWNYAFLHSETKKCFVPPSVVSKYGITDGQTVKCLIVYDYEKSKASWNWICLSIMH